MAWSELSATSSADQPFSQGGYLPTVMAGPGAAAGAGRPKETSIAWGSGSAAGTIGSTPAAGAGSSPAVGRGPPANGGGGAGSADSGRGETTAGPVAGAAVAAIADVKASAPAALLAGVAPNNVRSMAGAAVGWGGSSPGHEADVAAGMKQLRSSMPEAVPTSLIGKSAAAAGGVGEAPQQSVATAAAVSSDAEGGAGINMQQDKAQLDGLAAASSSSNQEMPGPMTATSAVVAADTRTASGTSSILPSTAAFQAPSSSSSASAAGATNSAAAMVLGRGGSGRKLGISSLAVGIGPGSGLGSAGGGGGVLLSPVSRLSLGESVASDSGRPSLSTDSEGPSRLSLGGVSRG